jgi:hypothetical protein
MTRDSLPSPLQPLPVHLATPLSPARAHPSILSSTWHSTHSTGPLFTSGAISSCPFPFRLSSPSTYSTTSTPACYSHTRTNSLAASSCASCCSARSSNCLNHQWSLYYRTTISLQVVFICIVAYLGCRSATLTPVSTFEDAREARVPGLRLFGI